MRLIDAAEEVRKVARFYRAMETVAEALTTIGSLEQATQEAEAKLATTNAQIDKAGKDFDAVAAKISCAMTDAEGIVATAQKEAQNIERQAKAKAQETVAVAKEKAAQAEGKAKDAEARAKQVADEVEAKAAELAFIEAKLAKAQAQIAKLLGQ